MKQDFLEIVILAGGKSSRMGQDKGLMLFHQKPMIEWILEASLKTNYPVRIIANNPAYSQFGVPVISDFISEKGPMGGLFTALTTTKSKYVFLLSCDTPLIKNEILQYMISKLTTQEVLVASLQGKILPLLAIYHSDLKKVVLENISSNKLKMQELIRSLVYQELEIPNFLAPQPEVFANINTIDEFAELQKGVVL